MKNFVWAAMALAMGAFCGCSSQQHSTAGSSATSLGDGGSQGSGSGSTTSSSGSIGSSGSSGATSGTTATTGASGTSGDESSGTSGSSHCTFGSCEYDNDCGGSKSCLNNCCIQTGDNCDGGSHAYGNCAPGYMVDANDCCAPDAGSAPDGGHDGGSSGTSGSCNFDGGLSGGFCNPDCGRGFHCQAGQCVLNGGSGPVQVTLRWGQGVDLDLHVVEPGGCEIWYGDTNRAGDPSSCGAVGSLDLDSNPACNLDNVDIENVIYPNVDAGGAPPPTGTYTVRVDDYDDDPTSCTGGGRTIPYEVIVRHSGLTQTFCESFPPNSQDEGSEGSGRTITTFTYP